MKKEKQYSSPYNLDGRLPLGTAVPLGLQHVLAMFVGNLSPLLIIMGICGITAGEGLGALRLTLLQNAMIVSGLVTFIQLYPIGPIGSRLPIVMGTSSGFIGISSTMATSMMAGVAAGVITTDAMAGIYAYGAIMGACLIGGVFEMGLGFCIKRLRKYFPPVVTGTVVMVIGFSLIPVGVGFFGGGSDAADYGSGPNLLLGFITLASILFFQFGFKGFPSIASVLLGIVVGYLASLVMGFVLPTTYLDAAGNTQYYAYVTQWSQVDKAPWFTLPSLLPVHLQFNAKAIIPMCVLFIVTAIETVGDTSGVAEGGLGREATDKEMAGAVIADGFGSSLATLFGVMPNTSFSENVGLVSMTKVVNRFAIATGAGILVLAGLFPKLGAVISIMPQSVLGGAALIMFASIVLSGIQLITKEPMDARNTTIVAVALGVGYGLSVTTSVHAAMPVWLTYLFGGAGIVPAALIAILLNIILPNKKQEEATKQ